MTSPGARVAYPSPTRNGTVDAAKRAGRPSLSLPGFGGAEALIRLVAGLIAAIWTAHISLAAQNSPRPFDGALLDKAAFSQEVAGKESPISDQDAKGGPSAVVWTRQRRPEWRGVRFGDGRTTGTRYLRIGFTNAVPIGSLLVRGGGALSVLKSDAAYPGRLDDDFQWLPAARLGDDGPTHAEVDEDDYAVWVLPTGTRTRALRFSHSPRPGDRETAGYLGGVWIDERRFGNVAPQALVRSSARDDVSAKLVDRSNNRMWLTWCNGEQGAALRISPEHPEIVTLTWPKPVTLDGVCLLWTGFAAAELDAFRGAEDEPVYGAPEVSWERVGARADMDALYPMALGPNWISFEPRVTTRALRLRIVDGAKSGHPHLRDKVKDGRRVWLGELVAAAPLAGDAPLDSLVLPRAIDEPPPIPIRFTLPAPGLVTLVIDDADGRRVRNLVSETPFPAGENIAWWDGSDDLLRDPDAARHGLYHLPTRFVAPGPYTVRGLWHEPLTLRYEFSVYNAGRPAWRTADDTGCWLTTHTPPTSVAVAPGRTTADGRSLVFMGAYVAEGGHGLQWLLEDGTKVGGQHWLGGTWTGAPTLAVDRGDNAVSNLVCYVGSVWEGELRLTAKTRELKDHPVFKHKLGDDPRKDPKNTPPVLEGFDGGDRTYVLGGIAAHDGAIVCSMVRQNELLVVDARKGELAAHVALADPRGLAFDRQGRLLALSGTQLVRFGALTRAPETVIAKGLEDPRHVAVDADGRFLVTDRGRSHQVKVFSPDGTPNGTLGKPGAPGVGLYDPLHMNNPNGVAVDTQGRVWVAECDNYPRRVSVWSRDGTLLRAYYGPSEYGGGGTLDPVDPKRFYYRGMEFTLDWQAGTDALARVYARPNPLLVAHYGPYSADTPLYPPKRRGERYFTSCYTHTPTHGDNAAFIWRDTENGEARLVAALGDAWSWAVLRDGEFRSLWPEGTEPDKEHPRPEQCAAFSWSDANGDGRPQAGELIFAKVQCRGVTVMNDLAFVVSRYDDGNVRFDAVFDGDGIPHYDLTKPRELGPAGGRPPSSGGNQSLALRDGWTLNTNAPEPFSPYGPGGTLNGEPRWSYPSPWPGLHASHEAAVPDRPGMIVGHTRLLGGWIRGACGPMFCLNGNMGNMYLMTADGRFVATLFNDIRLRPNWAAPIAVRGMDVTDVSLHDENFWPSITQTADGRVFLVDGARSSLVRIDGLDTLRALPEQPLAVTADDIGRAREWFAQTEAKRQRRRGSGILRVGVRDVAPSVDGTLDDWPAGTDWAFIDRRGTRANFNSDSRPYEVTAAVALTGTHLYAAWRTNEKNLLNNSGETPNALFKNGGCLDIMLATNPEAPPQRMAPVRGDERLLVTQVKGATRALLYRATVPGTTDPVAFSSPWRTIDIDAVDDVSDRVTLATDKAGAYELGVPLSVLLWAPEAGRSYRADIGVLRGADGQTTQRVYWNNKATAITADVPSEAELTPRLWGEWRIVPLGH